MKGEVALLGLANNVGGTPVLASVVADDDDVGQFEHAAVPDQGCSAWGVVLVVGGERQDGDGVGDSVGVDLDVEAEGGAVDPDGTWSPEVDVEQMDGVAGCVAMAGEHDDTDVAVAEPGAIGQVVRCVGRCHGKVGW